ncbi:MAG: hypothetical protein ACFFCM_00825 [Promethearchaeota archaeon]
MSEIRPYLMDTEEIVDTFEEKKGKEKKVKKWLYLTTDRMIGYRKIERLEDLKFTGYQHVTEVHYTILRRSIPLIVAGAILLSLGIVLLLSYFFFKKGLSDIQILLISASKELAPVLLLLFLDTGPTLGFYFIFLLPSGIAILVIGIILLVIGLRSEGYLKIYSYGHEWDNFYTPSYSEAKRFIDLINKMKIFR